MSTFASRLAKCNLDDRDKMYIAHLGILYKTMRDIFSAPFMTYELRATLMDQAAVAVRSIMDYWKDDSSEKEKS